MENEQVVNAANAPAVPVPAAADDDDYERTMLLFTRMLRERNARGVVLDSIGYRGAVAILENVRDRRPVILLTIGTAARGQDEDEIRIGARNDEMQAFRTFVALLAQRRGGRAIRKIAFEATWVGLPEGAMERLFGDVLPNHRTVRTITLNLEDLPVRVFRTLTESIPTTPNTSRWPRCLAFTGVDLDPEFQAQAAQAVADMLRRNAAIHTLILQAVLDSVACERICQALPGNTNLQELHVRVKEISSRTLVGVEGSSLKVLSVRGSFSEGAVPSLAVQLRTNTTLQSLTLFNTAENGRIGDTQALLELLRTHNYTLFFVTGKLGLSNDDPTVREQFRHYDRRNYRIRKAFVELESPDPEKQRLLMTPARLGSLLELVSDVPTALFKVVKLHANEILERLNERYQHNP